METQKKSALRPIEIRKNGRETLRLALDTYKGNRLVSFSLWLTPAAGASLRPARGGFGVRVELLPVLITALGRIEAEARAIGWLPPRPPVACEACGISFEAPRAHAGFCSQECRTKASRSKTRAKRKGPREGSSEPDVC
jgi:hypothetical protein